MTSESPVYLVLLKKKEERESWGFAENAEVAICLYNDDSLKIWQWKEWLSVSSNKFPKPMVTVFNDDGLTGRHAECKAKLYELLGANIRIWGHSGDLDLNDKLTAVRESFIRKGFEEAGFTVNTAIMPFSLNTGYPWKAKIEGFRDALNIKRTNPAANQAESSSAQLISFLELAWDDAIIFFNIEQPARCLLESLFPLYVDLSNNALCPLPEQDIRAAVVAAAHDLEAALQECIHTPEGNTNSHIENLQISLERIANSNPSSPQVLSRACCDLIKALEKIQTGNAPEFCTIFVSLSEAYLSRLDLDIYSISATPSTAAPK